MSRKLDALVAERVMKWHKGTIRNGGGFPIACWKNSAGLYVAAIDYWEHSGTQHQPWKPLEDIIAAWSVAEKMREMYGCGVSVNIVRAAFVLASGRGSYSCEIMGGRLRYSSPFLGLSATAITAPLAICLAALRAVGVPEAEIQEAQDADNTA